MAGAVVLLVSGCNLATTTKEIWSDLTTTAHEQTAERTDTSQTDSATIAPTEAASSEAVALVQKRLTELGYKPGVVDGVRGPRTDSAIRRYQADTGLPIDGRISESLLERLARSEGVAAVSEGPALLGDSPQAIYEPGDTFVYSAGYIEIVTGVNGDIVHWEAGRGSRYTSYRNFLLPRIAWEAPEHSGRTTLDRAPDSLWPQTAGEKISFSAKTVLQDSQRPDSPTTFSEQWQCMIEGTERLSVAAGTFDTVKMSCWHATAGTDKQRERIWYYAPAIRHYVRRDERFGAESSQRRLELIAIRPATEGWPPVTRAGLHRALQHALEAQPKGRSITWKSSGVEARFTITPTSPRRSDTDTYCRNFLQARSSPAGNRVFPGVACRQPSGQWTIPGLDQGEAAGLDTLSSSAPLASPPVGSGLL